ncbi:uncharacterized protein LOC113210952 [Frankliniella occidentalis]|uniref:Uncharacterized protein LOC113210952 n=1 Tax=Frankliniella occidentalis TaxID=133901 RepID=A0A6J1T2T8_FRAOC|nr:uncharacterized protein LOC113210952 [Frankliniella occidentalis]XP_052129943.1 uncharacterized protein LOC113210952 [Frankliniella occidentalis]
MDKVKESLKKYTLSVEKLCLLWEGLAKRATKSMCEIETLSEQLLAATNISGDAPMICEQFPDLHTHLIYQIFVALEKELELLNCIVHEVGENTDSLNKLALQIQCMRICTDYVPPLSISMIMEYISDSTQYFRAQYATLKIALLSLDFRDGLSVKNLRNAFFEPSDLKAHIQCCRQIGTNILSSIDS